MRDWREQEAINETIFRKMNEWTEGAGVEPTGIRRLMDVYLCECSDRRCTDPISMTRSEYEDVRRFAVRFAVASNHENPEIDRVVSENARFTTVEKIFRAGARIARASDPRRARASGPPEQERDR